MISKKSESRTQSPQKLFQEPSKIDLVATTLNSSFWVLAKAIKIAFQLNKEMLRILIRRHRHGLNRQPISSAIFTNYGVWFVDLYGVIRQEMDFKA
ncbi:hypothetical protein MJD09_11625 [bacterium]|nr:hypothetical protein [bacterium]